METHFVKSDQVKLHVKCFGDQKNPPIILLHGFPEFWISYEPLVEYLKDDFYLIIPDQRGYNLSSKPHDVKKYRIDYLAKDVLSLLNYFQLEKTTLVGHDWGGAVAWYFAYLFPKKIRKLIILNVPHPNVLFRYMMSNPSQLRKSWYILFFQLPYLPEFFARINNWKILELAMVNSSFPMTFSKENIQSYKKAWSQPNAFRSMVNWYRAAFRLSLKIKTLRIEPDTLILWGIYDNFLNTETAKLSLHYCRSAKMITTKASHWIQHEKPRWVAQKISQFSPN